ncbi:hypothetical protein [Streptomyces lavendofoliae]|uniref:SCO2584 family spore wall biosynthesis protein n=1 Tax=Streptomyces lavendofoliae TaxID=67314 RepID=UPI00300E7528
MPDDVGGRPFPDGWEPDDDRGGADDDFASVVFDEDFVRAAEIHEPSAVERLLAAAQARADAEAAPAGAGGASADDPYGDGYAQGARAPGYADRYGPADNAGPYGAHGGALRPYRPSSRWHRPVAWVLAVVMGVGMVALAFTAVYRGSSSGGRGGPVPAPATSGIDAPPPPPQPARTGPEVTDRVGTGPHRTPPARTASPASAGHGAAPVPTLPRTP